MSDATEARPITYEEENASLRQQLHDMRNRCQAAESRAAVAEAGRDASRNRMTFAQFAAANRARCEHPDGFGHELGSWSLSDWITAVAGELGEAANIAKKLNRVRDGIPGNTASEGALRVALREETADVFIYLDLLAQSQGFRLEDAVREKFDATSARIGYPARLA